jgi:hypothetical protein
MSAMGKEISKEGYAEYVEMFLMAEGHIKRILESYFEEVETSVCCVDKTDFVFGRMTKAMETHEDLPLSETYAEWSTRTGKKIPDSMKGKENEKAYWCPYTLKTVSEAFAAVEALENVMVAPKFIENKKKEMEPIFEKWKEEGRKIAAKEATEAPKYLGGKTVGEYVKSQRTTSLNIRDAETGETLLSLSCTNKPGWPWEKQIEEYADCKIVKINEHLPKSAEGASEYWKPPYWYGLADLFFDIGGKYQVFPKESVEKAFSEELDGLKAGVAEVVKGFDDGKPVEDLKAGLTLASECADSCAALFPALKDPDAGMADVLKKANGIIADVGTELKAIEAKAIEIGGDVKEEYYRVAEDIDFREEAGVLGAGAEGAVEKENESGSESYQD